MPSIDLARSASHRRAAVAPAAAFLVITLAACGPATGSPSITPPGTTRPTPTPVAADVASPADAAALVIATNELFAGAQRLDPNVIGASRWWEASPLPGGGYAVEITIGWGDCPAGCIDRHVWSYEVAPDGRVELVGETGPELPARIPG